MRVLWNQVRAIIDDIGYGLESVIQNEINLAHKHSYSHITVVTTKTSSDLNSYHQHQYIRTLATEHPHQSRFRAHSQTEDKYPVSPELIALFVFIICSIFPRNLVYGSNSNLSKNALKISRSRGYYFPSLEGGEGGHARRWISFFEILIPLYTIQIFVNYFWI